MTDDSPAYTDSRGRTTADRIAAIHRSGDPVTDQHRTDARLLLESLLLAARGHGVALTDFDGVVDLPGGCVDVILAQARRS